MKKRLFAVILLAALTLALCACGARVSVPFSPGPTAAIETKNVVSNRPNPCLSCEVVEENGKLVHYMNRKGMLGYVSEHWEMERYTEAAGGNEELAERYCSLYNSGTLVTEVIPELDIEWPETFLPFMFTMSFPELAEAKYSRGGAADSLRFEGDVCPYTGLTIAEHEAGEVYYPVFGLEDIAELNIMFSVEAAQPYACLCCRRGENGDRFYDYALENSKWIDTEYNGRMLGLYGAGSMTSVAFNGDSSVCVTLTYENLTLDELIALMDDNDLWGLWDMLLNAWPESV